MDEPPTMAEPAETRRLPRRLWPWVIGTLMLCVVAIGWSVWWPVHQANQLIEFARDNNGNLEIEYNHPKWLSWLTGDRVYFPYQFTIIELEHLEKIPTLKKIVLRDQFNFGAEDELNSAWNQFMKIRPDVEIVRE